MTGHEALVGLCGDNGVDMEVSSKCERIITVSFEGKSQELSIIQESLTFSCFKNGHKKHCFPKIKIK